MRVKPTMLLVSFSRLMGGLWFGYRVVIYAQTCIPKKRPIDFCQHFNIDGHSYSAFHTCRNFRVSSLVL